MLNNQCIIHRSYKFNNTTQASTKRTPSSYKIHAIQRRATMCQLLFSLQLVLVAGFAVFLTIHGLVSNSHTHHFYPLEWYPPLLASTACGGIVGFTWQLITASHPKMAIRAAFYMSPPLTCAMGIMFLCINSAALLEVGVACLMSAAIQSLYGFWVSPRFEYAATILSDSIAFPPPKTKVLSLSSTLISVLYCCLLVSGIGGARALGNRMDIAVVIAFILVILLSMAWTMYFLKNAMLVAISRVQYMHFAGGVHMDTSQAICDTIKYSAGGVSLASIFVPIIGLFRGVVRLATIARGESNSNMYAYLTCYDWPVTYLVKRANRWGFVQVGVRNKEFSRASIDTWEMFTRVGMMELIDLDLTGAFCFLSGVAAGAICSLVSGIWSLVIHSSYAMEVSIFAFLIGYFLCRLAMAWPQACVSACYVAYAENPQSPQFALTIPVRLEQIQRSEAVQSF